MRKDGYEASITDCYKAPKCVNLLILVKRKGDKKVKVCQTHRSLQAELTKKLDDIEYIKVVDIKRETVRDMMVFLARDFLDSWREAYFFEDWYVPFQFFY